MKENEKIFSLRQKVQYFYCATTVVNTTVILPLLQKAKIGGLKLTENMVDSKATVVNTTVAFSGEDVW